MYVTLLLSGRVAVISAADGRFVCAAGAAHFSSLRCGAACQFEVLTPLGENGNVRADNTSKRGRVAVPLQPRRQPPLLTSPLPPPPTFCLRKFVRLLAVGRRRISLYCSQRRILPPRLYD
jgi:hypothetical protein